MIKAFGRAMILLCLVSSPVRAGMMYLVVGDSAPVLKGPMVTGGHLTLYWSGSRLTLVNFWATWCEPCKQEMPILQELSGRYPKKDLRVIGVNVDKNRKAPVDRFLKDLGIRYTVIRGERRITAIWGGIGVLPTTFLVDSRGKVVDRFKGASEETLARMSDRIEAYLAPM